MNDQYRDFVKSRAKNPTAILIDLNVEKSNLIHAAMGISGEAGELMDAIKKHVIYNKPLDRDNAIEELGDLEFYMELLRQELGVSREVCLGVNIAKLSKRYETGYTDQQAIDRADKPFPEWDGK